MIHSSWSVRRTLLQHWRHISKSPAPLLVTGCIRGSAANAARVSGAWFLVRRHALYQGRDISNFFFLMFACTYTVCSLAAPPHCREERGSVALAQRVCQKGI